MDSPKLASNALSALEGATQEAPKEDFTSLEDGVLDGVASWPVSRCTPFLGVGA